MNYTIQPEDNNLTVYLSGRLTFSESQNFKALMEKVKTFKGQKCIFNLSDLEFIDSAGLGMFMMLKGISDSCPFNVTMTEANGQVKRLLEISKFSDLIPTE